MYMFVVGIIGLIIVAYILFSLFGGEETTKEKDVDPEQILDPE